MDKTKKRAHIYWRSPEQWGSLIYAYVKDRGMINTVCTFYELTEGADSVEQKFHGLENELLIKSLQTLELQRKAEIFPNDEGVKFF
jgi:ESCRT-II complex subunit VPS25